MAFENPEQPYPTQPPREPGHAPQGEPGNAPKGEPGNEWVRPEAERPPKRREGTVSDPDF